MPKHPLAEVFGFPTHNFSLDAERYRRSKLCPFNNKVPSCTKDKAENPLGVCSVYEASKTVITCPVRFRQDWLIAEDAAAFFFPAGQSWTSLTEIRINDKYGKSAGNIDLVLVGYDDTGNRNYPRPDYLSSSRKRLAPQLIYKGGILHAGGKKQAVAVDSNFFNTLPSMDEIDQKEAAMAWLIYDLQLDPLQNRYHLVRSRTVYTRFNAALNKITTTEPGDVQGFMDQLQERLDEKPENSIPPDAPTLLDAVDIEGENM